MKKFGKSSNFWLCLLINMIFNLEWTIPAWILLALHYIIDWPVWPFWLALGLWIINIIFWMDVVGWASGCASEADTPKENKNPYSQKGMPSITKPRDDE